MLLAAPLPAGAQQESWRPLRGMRAVALDVAMAPDHPGIPLDEVERRLADLLANASPLLRVDAQAPDALRVLISVRAVSGTELRGFYLPFSGVYGVGPVRLVVERPATLAGQPGPAPAVVWEAERLVAGPWHRAGALVMRLLPDLAAAFLDDHRRAHGQ